MIIWLAVTVLTFKHSLNYRLDLNKGLLSHLQSNSQVHLPSIHRWRSDCFCSATWQVREEWSPQIAAADPLIGPEDVHCLLGAKAVHFAEL